MFTPRKGSSPPRTFGLLTDFGMADPYVGQMKAIFARKAPNCTLVDISHDVSPFNVAQAGFFLASSYVHFPEDAIILSIVDPGVGTSRKIVGLQLDGRLLIAPDNGLLTLALSTTRADTVRAFDFSRAMDAPDKVSNTFHGRDVFAPLAAWLALGGDLRGLGGEIDPADLISCKWSRPNVGTKAVTAHVLHIDRFGNCVLNIEAGSLGSPKNFRLVSPTSCPLAYVATYGDMQQGEPGLLEGSQGFLEIAINQRSAARQLGLSMGDEISLVWE